MLEQKRLGNHGTGPARSEQTSQGSDEIDQKGRPDRASQNRSRMRKLLRIMGEITIRQPQARALHLGGVDVFDCELLIPENRDPKFICFRKLEECHVVQNLGVPVESTPTEKAPIDASLREKRQALLPRPIACTFGEPMQARVGPDRGRHISLQVASGSAANLPLLD